MPFELQPAGDGVDSVLTLAGRLGVQQARALWDVLQPVMAGSQSIRLQAGQLDEVDTSIIQILLRLSARTDRFQIGEISDGLIAALKARGLEAALTHLPAPDAQTAQLQPKLLAKAARQGHG